MLPLQIICTAFDMLFIIDSASETQLCPNNDSTKHEQSWSDSWQIPDLKKAQALWAWVIISTDSSEKQIFSYKITTVSNLCIY